MPSNVVVVSELSASESAASLELLVSELRENLKLSASGLKAPSQSLVVRRRHRASPYAVPPCSRHDPAATANSNNISNNINNANNCDKAAHASQLRKWNHRRRYPSTCLTSSSSSSTASNADDPLVMLQELISDGSLIKEAVRRLQLGLSPKVRAAAFYDSEEEDNGRPACHV